MKPPGSLPTIGRRQMLQGLASGVGVLGASALWNACRSGQPLLVDFSEKTRNFLPNDYEGVYERWTRHAQLVSANEGTIIEVWGTLKSWEYREGYVEKYAQTYALSTDAKATLLASELKKARESYELHLTVQTSDYRSNDLERRESPWRMSLVDGTGDEIFPKEVESPRVPVSYEETFFPNKTSFSRSYMVLFEHERASGVPGFGGAASGELTLRLRGPLGGVELTWQSK